MAKGDRPVTMKTVAEKAGVSLMTVSRALRNTGRVSQATRAEIQRIAKELGYRPNPLVTALMTDLRRGRPDQAAVQKIAFVTSHETPDCWREDFTPSDLFTGAYERADLLGFELMPFWTREPEMSGRRLSNVLCSRGITGVIIAPYPVPATESVDLGWERLAAVALGYSMREPKVHRVANHSLHAMRTAIGELVERGYQRIGLAISADDNERVDDNWFTGFVSYQSRIPKQDRVPIFMPPKVEPRAFEKWRMKYRPEVILGDDYGLRCLRDVQVNMPGDVGFVSLSYHPSLGDVAGIVPDHHEVGAAAVEALIEQLYHNEKGIPKTARSVLVEGRWREGGSIRSSRLS